MTTTTARKLTSKKYPLWTVERLGPTDYLMTRPGGVFAISVTHSKTHGWTGELMTMQRGGWAPAKTPFRHAVIGCIAEADRRETTIRKYAARPLGR